MAGAPPRTTSDNGTSRTARRLRLALLLAASLIAVTGCGLFVWSRCRLRQERAEALRVAKSGRFADAEPRLRRARERDPDDFDVVKALALGHLGGGDLTAAEDDLSRWCTLRPDDAEAFKLRMDVRHRRARAAASAADKQDGLAAALADGLRAVELDPADDPVAREVVWLLTQVGRFDEADRLCRRCLQTQPGDPWLTYLLAKIVHARGAAAEAATLLDLLLRDQPQFTDGLLLRAVLYNDAGESDRAVPLLRQVVALDRAHRLEARYQLSLALARTGQTEEAEALMAAVQKDNLDGLLAATHHADAAGVKLQLAEACLANGKEDEALRLLGPLLEQDAGSAPAHALLAAYYGRRGQAEKAAEHRRRAGQ